MKPLMSEPASIWIFWNWRETRAPPNAVGFLIWKFLEKSHCPAKSKLMLGNSEAKLTPGIGLMFRPLKSTLVFRPRNAPPDFVVDRRLENDVDGAVISANVRNPSLFGSFTSTENPATTRVLLLAVVSLAIFLAVPAPSVNFSFRNPSVPVALAGVALTGNGPVPLDGPV